VCKKNETEREPEIKMDLIKIEEQLYVAEIQDIKEGECN